MLKKYEVKATPKLLSRFGGSVRAKLPNGERRFNGPDASHEVFIEDQIASELSAVGYSLREITDAERKERKAIAAAARAKASKEEQESFAKARAGAKASKAAKKEG